MLKTLLTWFFTFSMSSNSHAGVGNWMETCPAGYILVPKNTEYVDQNFCVMKYEARARNDTTGVIDADGCNEVGCTTSNWGLAANSPASTSSGLPWRQISLANGKAECRSLGPRYDVISNAEWQTIARNIELVPQNWSGGAVGSGCIWYGNSGDNNSCGYDGANPEGGTGRNTRARHFLSNGQEIWDLAGNVTEGVLDDGTQLNYGPQDYIANVTTGTHTTPGILLDGVARVAKNQFGPSGSYTCNAGNEYCGFGYAGISGGGGVMVRGGAWTEVSWAGVFHAINWLAAGTADASGGFRCVYHPTDPCLNGKVVSSGTRCRGTGQSSDSQLFVGMLNGYDYFATPSGCTNSSTPTCAGGTDTVTTVWRGLTGSNVDIAGITNVVGTATPSDPGQSGETITPIMIADASVASDSPGDYCANMTYAGFTDWFLPSKSAVSQSFVPG